MVHEFKIDGPALREGVSLHIAVAALDNFHSVVDKTYLAFTGAKKLSTRDREIFQLKASKFERSSFLTEFEIVIAGLS